MPATQLNKELRALCYEHHVEMRLDACLLNGEQKDKQTLAYTCLEPDCPAHYSILRGYFIPSQNGNKHGADKVPSVRCLHDGMPMYLAEVDQEKKSSRLWLCPDCGTRRTNEDDLVGVSSQEVQEVSGECGAKRQTPKTTQM
jgi:hypothetical protein